jgi:hypothetical protein
MLISLQNQTWEFFLLLLRFFLSYFNEIFGFDPKHFSTPKDSFWVFFFFVILCMPFKPQNSKLNVCSVKVSNSFVEALHLNVLWVHFMFLNAKKKFPFFTLSHPFCVIQFEKWDLAVIKNIRNDAVRFEAEAERESEKKSEKK